jgi:hypothetical protein
MIKYNFKISFYSLIIFIAAIWGNPSQSQLIDPNERALQTLRSHVKNKYPESSSYVDSVLSFARVLSEILSSYQAELKIWGAGGELGKIEKMFGDSDPANLSVEKIQEIFKLLVELREKIQLKRKGEFERAGLVEEEGDELEAPSEIARENVLMELKLLENQLKLSKNETEAAEKIAKLESERKIAEETKRLLEEENTRLRKLEELEELSEKRKTETGFEFTRRKELEAKNRLRPIEKRMPEGEIWQDPSGMIWFDVAADGMDWNTAMKYCQDRGGVLPDKDDFFRLREYMGAENQREVFKAPKGYKEQILPNLKRREFWLSSVSKADRSFFFNGVNGGVYYVGRRSEGAVRCVLLGPEAWN